MSPVFWLRIGAVWGFLAIAMGAFGAHGLEDRFAAVGDLTGKMTPEHLKANFQTAAQYQMYCALRSSPLAFWRFTAAAVSRFNPRAGSSWWAR